MKDFNYNFLRREDPIEAKKVLKFCQEKRLNHFRSTNGYTPKKQMRHVYSFPYWVAFHPEYKKYFDPLADNKDRKKNLDKLAQRLMFETGRDYRVVDKV
jgi:hypothetical protein